MYPTGFTSLGIFILFFILKSKLINCKEIPVRQHPSDLRVETGHSATMICAFDLDVSNRTEIDVFWVKQVNQSETDVLHISSRRFPTMETNIIRNYSEGSFSVSGNLRRGFIIFELKHIQKVDFGLYTCHVTRTIPPPPMEGRGTGTNIVETGKLTAESGSQHATFNNQYDITITCLVIYAGIITILGIACWIYQRRSQETQNDSLIYEDMRKPTSTITQAKSRN